MPTEQADQGQPETKSYDAALSDDVRAAFDEVSNAAESGPDDAAPDAPAPAAPKDAARDSDAKPAVREDASGRLRDESGKFATKVGSEPARPDPAAATGQPDARAAPAAPSAPPPGWSVQSKAAWDALPEHVRADIIKREHEVDQGFAQYEGMKVLRPYVELARERGTSLPAALDHYIGIENLLRQDFVQGVLRIASNAGIQPQQLAVALASYLPSAPNQNGAADDGQWAQPFDPNVLQPWLNPLTQQVNQLTQLFAQQQQAEHARSLGVVNSALDRFIADPAHRYFQNVEPTIIQLIESGIVPRTGDHVADLNKAYDMACNMHPEIRELMIKDRLAKGSDTRRQSEKDAAEKARLASRSITGSPSNGAAAPASKRPDGVSYDDDLYADVRAAYQQVGSRV